MNNPGREPAAFWDQRYEDDGYVFGQDPNLWMLENAGLLVPGMTAFVPGDGEGRNGVWLAEKGLAVTTVDASPIGVEKARKLAAARGVRLDAQVGDLRNWAPPKRGFDVVVSAFVHVNPDERTAVHQGMAGTLKAGGLLLLEGFAPDHIGIGKGGPSVKEMMFTADGLREDFGDMLDIEYLAETGTVLPSSERHGGPAVVIRLRARKKT